MSAATTETIIARLAKMKALAVEGVGGEREAASRLIKTVAAKYGIDLAALDGMDEAESSHPLDISRGWKLDLFRQLMALMRLEKYGSVKVLDHCFINANYRLRKGRWHIVSYDAKCTNAQFIELQAKFAILSRDYDRQRKALFRAFLYANDLLCPYDPDSPPTDEEIAAAASARRLARGIQKSTLMKQLSSATEEARP